MNKIIALIARAVAFVKAEEQKTVDTILGTFHRTLDELKAHRLASLAKADICHDDAHEHLASAEESFSERDAHVAEAARADTVVAKITTLISQPGA